MIRSLVFEIKCVQLQNSATEEEDCCCLIHVFCIVLAKDNFKLKQSLFRGAGFNSFSSLSPAVCSSDSRVSACDLWRAVWMGIQMHHGLSRTVISLFANCQVHNMALM